MFTFHYILLGGEFLDDTSVYNIHSVMAHLQQPPILCILIFITVILYLGLVLYVQ
jgi:hypothetical protein